MESKLKAVLEGSDSSGRIAVICSLGSKVIVEAVGVKFKEVRMLSVGGSSGTEG